MGKWRGNWRMECVASTLNTTSEHGVSSVTTADAHTSADSSQLNWPPRQFKWTRPLRRKTKSGFCACAITFQLASTVVASTINEHKGWAAKRCGFSRMCVRFETGVGFKLHQLLPTDEPGRNYGLRGNGFRQEMVLEAPQKLVGPPLRPLPPNVCRSLGVRSSCKIQDKYEKLNIVPVSYRGCGVRPDIALLYPIYYADDDMFRPLWTIFRSQKCI